MSATQPVTKAGRALADDARKRFPTPRTLGRMMVEDFVRDILAIEAEAAAAERERIRAALLGPDAHVDALYERHTRAILDAAAGSDR